MDKITILYFLEDRAQESFIKAIVRKIAEEAGIPNENLIHDIRSSRGGSMVINEFKKFIKDTMKIGITEADFLVTAVDGNCRGYIERTKELSKCVKAGHPLSEKIVYAVPDPHIERWYIMDQRAFKDGVGLNKAPALPSYKCDRDYYKRILIQTLKEEDRFTLPGVAVYAERIVDNIEDLYSLGKQEQGFKNFIDGLREMFRKLKQS